jgi:hypothetical protein
MFDIIPFWKEGDDVNAQTFDSVLVFVLLRLHISTSPKINKQKPPGILKTQFA